MSQHHPSGNSNSFNNTNSFNNVWNNCSVGDEKSEILAWLSPLEPQRRHHDVQTRRVDEVGDWLIQTEEYRNWFGGIGGGNSGGSALFCYGGPGVGKTYISSLVIDSLCKEAVEGNAGVACFYFDFAALEEQSPAAILGSVLKQVVGGLDKVPEAIVKAFRDREKAIGGQKLPLAEIVEFLQDISSSRSTYICIDALDECPSKHRVKLLDLLNQVLQKSHGDRLFLTGRPHIRSEVDKHLAGRAATRSITPTKNDIITFLRAKLKEDTIPDAMDESLEEKIIENIPEMVSEIFLLVFLSIETILQETTVYRRRQKFRAMENGLDVGSAYEVTLGRIKAQGEEKARLGMAALMWISHSRRPLQVDEICHAIAIRIGSNDLNNDDIPAVSTLLNCCQGLVTIEKDTSTIRLIHFTLQEYLCTHPDLFDRAHSTMAETCLTYLNLRHVTNLSGDPHPDLRDAPLLEYSSLYWGTHMQMELSDRAKTFALPLLDQFGGHIAAKTLWKSIHEGLPRYRYSDDKPFSALHCISYFGIAEVANILIETNRWDVNQRDGAGMTPLIWAARYGHEEVVGSLLRKKQIQPDLQDSNYGRTALSWAAGNGHEGVVRLFLAPRFVNPESIGRRWGKVAGMVGVFYSGRYVNPNSWSIFGDTPLSLAAVHGHEGIVKLLLGREDVDPNRSNGPGQTPLLLAANNGYEGIVKLLLGREDINPNSSSIFGETPLLLAASNGHQAIVKLLLERKDVDPNGSSAYSGTPLSLAAENGHEGTVKLLLERKDVDPNSLSAYSGVLLSSAAKNGYEGIMKLLLERKDVDPNNSSRPGPTPLSLAAENGHEGIVELLLGRKDVDPDSSVRDMPTSLSYAAKYGLEGIVKLLLGREDVNPNSKNGFGETPLSFAAERGHEGVVKLLLERNDVDPNGSYIYDRTPLLLAAMIGYKGIVKLLLERKDVSPNTEDRYCGLTPLLWAAENGHDGIVRLLLERKDVNPNILSRSGETPLTLAARNGRHRIVELLQAHVPKVSDS